MKAEDVIQSIEKLDQTLNEAEKLGYAIEVTVSTRLVMRKQGHQIVLDDVAKAQMQKLEHEIKVNSNGGLVN